MRRINRELIDTGIKRLVGFRTTEVLAEEEIEKHIRPGRKRILYLAPKYAYGHPEYGLDYGHYTSYHTFLEMDYSVIYFDYDRISKEYGTSRMNDMLREIVYIYHPDYLFYNHFLDIIDHDLIREISELPTNTIIWLSDDHWRYEELRPIWSLFDYIVTTDYVGYKKRKEEGLKNVILSQWATNPSMYKRLDLPKIYDVSFLGMPYGNRAKVIGALRKKGINVAVFGRGWGKLAGHAPSQAEFIRICNQSRIGLNIQCPSVGERLQLKGKDFMIPGCGSLLITNHSDEINKYFIVGKEIVTYSDVDDLAKKIGYYLEHEEERQEIAERGYKRVMKEHTYEKRYKEILDFIDRSQR